MTGAVIQFMMSKIDSSHECIIVIGGVAAGMSAASKVRRLRPDTEIFVFEKSGYISYSACGIPYYTSNIVKSPEDLVMYDAKFFKEKRNIDVFLHHEAIAINSEKQAVLIKDLEAGIETEYQYNKLLIATGGMAYIPPIKGVDLKGIFTVRTLKDGINLKNFIGEKSPKKALIVGAGYVGMEMSEAFVRLGIDVTMLARGPNILGTMDNEISRVIEDELKRNGVTLLKHTQVNEFTGENGYVSKANLNTGGTIDVNIAIIAAGVRPNSMIAKEAGIETDSMGAIKINERMETNIPGIYAAGDCADVFNQVLQRRVYAPLGTTANKQGKIAGENMAGENTKFRGIIGTSAFKVFDLQVARTGLTTKEAKREGFSYISNIIEENSRARYYPGISKIWVKLIARKDTGKILGAEMVGKEGVPKRIDVIATAITARMNLEDLGILDLSYAPPFAPHWDPILVAANDLKKQNH